MERDLYVKKLMESDAVFQLESPTFLGTTGLRGTGSFV